VFLNRNSELYDLILLDAYRGGYVPFHLLTREFYTLVKQRLTPGGAAAFNVHDGSKLYASTVKTLGEVFAALDLYPTGVGEGVAGGGAGWAGPGRSIRRRGNGGPGRYSSAAAFAFRCRRSGRGAWTSRSRRRRMATSSPMISRRPMSTT